MKGKDLVAVRSDITSSWREVDNPSKQFTGWVDRYMWGGIGELSPGQGFQWKPTLVGGAGRLTVISSQWQARGQS